MKDLQQATERICELKGSLIALNALMTALLHTMPDSARREVLRTFSAHAEVARTVLLNETISERTIAAFEHDVRRLEALGHGSDAPAPAGPAEQVDTPIDPLLLATARVATFDGPRGLTNASGFFFRRDDRLFLVSSRHVFIDEASHHHPDRLEVELHTDAGNLTRSNVLSMLLYRDGKAIWRQGRDDTGEIDVAVVEVDRQVLSDAVALAAFTPANLPGEADNIQIGQHVLMPGFPLGFHDGLHHLPVVRQGTVASPYGWRFQGTGCFLTDARTHRGISGAPVVIHAPDRHPLQWILVGIHSSRLDMGGRDKLADESLGLNSAWYPDILMTLTEA